MIPRWSPPTPAAVADRVEGFVVAIERLTASRRRLGAVAGLTLAGQLVAMAVLYFALEFFAEASLAVVLVIVPLSRVAAAVPTPGGIGSTEAALTGLLVALAGITPTVAGAVAIAYRTAAFWVPSLLGGTAAAGLLLGARS